MADMIERRLQRLERRHGAPEARLIVVSVPDEFTDEEADGFFAAQGIDRTPDDLVILVRSRFDAVGADRPAPALLMMKPR